MNSIIDSVNYFIAVLPALSALGTATVFIWSIVKFVSTRKRDHQIHNFKVYHRLIKELTQPDESGSTWMDRQVAVVFELRNFPEYFPVSERILRSWRTRLQDEKWRYLTTEIDLTLKYIRDKSC